MNKLIRYWNQNRLKIIITIIIIVLIIVVIQIINNFLANIQGSSTQTEWKVPDLSRPTESVLSGEEIPEETADKNAEIIKKFVDYCNEKSYQDAYNLLSQDCKEEVFNNIETFIEDYINEIFDTDEGARYVGEFSFGLNPAIQEPMGDILYDEKIIGSIHFTPGSAYQDAFNGNVSSIHWDMVLIQRPEYGGGEIYFDDELIRKDGKFLLE